MFYPLNESRVLDINYANKNSNPLNFPANWDSPKLQGYLLANFRAFLEKKTSFSNLSFSLLFGSPDDEKLQQQSAPGSELAKEGQRSASKREIPKTSGGKQEDGEDSYCCNKPNMALGKNTFYINYNFWRLNLVFFLFIYIICYYIIITFVSKISPQYTYTKWWLGIL